LMIGDLLALTAMHDGKHVTWMPAYGVEMRGGTANCTVVISDKRIGSPITGHPYSLITMNKPSLEKYAAEVRPACPHRQRLIHETTDITRRTSTPCSCPRSTWRWNRRPADGEHDRARRIHRKNERRNTRSRSCRARLHTPEKRKSLLPLNVKALEAGRNSLARKLIIRTITQLFFCNRSILPQLGNYFCVFHFELNSNFIK